MGPHLVKGSTRRTLVLLWTHLITHSVPWVHHRDKESLMQTSFKDEPRPSISLTHLPFPLGEYGL